MNKKIIYVKLIMNLLLNIARNAIEIYVLYVMKNMKNIIKYRLVNLNQI